MAEFKKGQFIRWTCTDDEGEFSHIGQVISHSKGMVTCTDTNGGEFGVHESDGTFEICKKPRNWAVAKPTMKKESKTVTTTAKSTRSEGGTTKLDLVVNLLRKDPPKNRKEAIDKIVAAGISTPAGASTYYNNAKKVL